MADLSLPTSREVKQRLNSEDTVIPLSEVQNNLKSKGIFSQKELNNKINPGSIFSSEELNSNYKPGALFTQEELNANIAPSSQIKNKTQPNRTSSNQGPSQSSLSKKENDIRLKQSQSFVGSSNDPFSTPARDNYQTYPYDYYAGTDCKIFFGDIWVDDIITIQYTVDQSKTPIYGYASQNFDAIAKGQIIVQGSLAIAFKETGYLNIIQATLDAQRADATELIKAKIDKYQETSKRGTAKFVNGINTIGEQSNANDVSFTYSANGSPQIIRQQQTIESILVDKKGTTSKAVSSALGIESNTRDFEDFAEVLEDSIWGDSNGKAFKLNDKLKRADEFDYNPNGGITTAKGRSYSEVLNIMLTFGDINDYRAEHTITVLNDVHFTSTSMVVSPNGDPIGEVYSFIARDVNDSINTSANIININPIKLNVGNDAIKLSKIEDANKIEQFLNKPNNSILIDFEAALTEDGWKPYRGGIDIVFNKSNLEPFVDSLCRRVEQAVNEIVVPQIVDTKNTQYIVKLLIGDNLDNDLTMILEQTIPGTRSYRVISPTRSGFSANNLISRDDLLKAKSMEPPVQKMPAPSKTVTKAKGVAQLQNDEIVTAEEQTANTTYAETYKIDPVLAAEIAESRKAPDKTREIKVEDVQKVYKHYGPLMEEAKRTIDSPVPVEFVASVAFVESTGNPNAISPKGAKGLLQMKDGTYGPNIEAVSKEHPGAVYTQAGVYSPKNNIYAATLEMKNAYNTIKKDNPTYTEKQILENVAAWYNGGPGAVVPSKNDPKYLVWSNPANNQELHPELKKGYAETQKYVPNVMAGYEAISKERIELQKEHAKVIETERQRKMKEYGYKNWGYSNDTTEIVGPEREVIKERNVQITDSLENNWGIPLKQ